MWIPDFGIVSGFVFRIPAGLLWRNPRRVIQSTDPPLPAHAAQV